MREYRFEEARKRCLNNIVENILGESEPLKNTSEEFRKIITNIITSTAKVAFSEGYDVGYLHAEDDAKYSQEYQ